MQVDMFLAVELVEMSVWPAELRPHIAHKHYVEKPQDPNLVTTTGASLGDTKTTGGNSQPSTWKRFPGWD